MEMAHGDERQRCQGDFQVSLYREVRHCSLGFYELDYMESSKQDSFQGNSLPFGSDTYSIQRPKNKVPLLHPVVGKPQHRDHTRWKPPDRGTYKVNYDGATFSKQEKVGVGVVIKNDEGPIMVSLLQQLPLPTTVA